MKNNEIQGLRGIGSVIVFLSHFVGALPFALQIGNIDLKYTIFGVFFNGTIVVYLFFILSGYYMYNSFNKDFNSYLYFEHLIKKVVQLYPIYIICISVGAILSTSYYYFDNGLIDNYFSMEFASNWNTKLSVKELLSQFVMIGKFDSHLINPPVWTMRMEMRMIIILPFIYVLLKKIENKKVVFYFVWALSIGISTFFVVYMGINTLEAFPYFMAGVFLSHIVKYKSKYIEKIELSKINIVAICIMMFLLLGIGQNYWLEFGEKISQYFISWINTFGWAIILFLIIKYPHNFKILKNKLLVFMGNISYSFYLSHYIILLSLRPLIFIFKNQNWISYFFWGIISFIITICCSIPLEFLRKKIIYAYKSYNKSATKPKIEKA